MTRFPAIISVCHPSLAMLPLHDFYLLCSSAWCPTPLISHRQSNSLLPLYIGIQRSSDVHQNEALQLQDPSSLESGLKHVGWLALSLVSHPSPLNMYTAAHLCILSKQVWGIWVSTISCICYKRNWEKWGPISGNTMNNWDSSKKDKKRHRPMLGNNNTHWTVGPSPPPQLWGSEEPWDQSERLAWMVMENQWVTP